MRLLKFSAWFLLVIVAALSFATLLSPARYEVAGIKVETRAAPRIGGGTELTIPPFGEATAKTHLAPVKLYITVLGVNETRLAKCLNDDITAQAYFDLLEKDAIAAGRKFLIRLIAIAAIGGALGSLILIRSWRRTVYASLLGVLVAGVLALTVYAQFNAAAFAQPRLTGPLSSAPWLVSAIEQGLNPVETLRADVQLVARNLRAFASKVEDWQPIVPERGTIRVLAVSDIHNNPAAFALMGRMIKDFQVDFVIDAGDITDFGTPIEATLLDQIRSLNRPYAYIAGNHDTRSITDTLTSIPNVIVLDNKTTRLNGIDVFGRADPAAGDMSLNSSAADRKALAKQLEKRIAKTAIKPMIVTVHDVRLVDNLIGKVPVIICGHTHKQSVRQEKGTTIINSGTTGAAGLRVLKNDDGQKLKFGLSLLYIDSHRRQLVAVDSVEVEGLEGNFALMRTLIDGNNSDDLSRALVTD